MSTTDRIEKSIVLRAPRRQVWRALTDVAEFGAWFGIALQGPFAAGHAVAGVFTRAGHAPVTLTFYVEAIEPEHRFVYRWHPFAVDPAVDYSAEPTTTCTFTLADDGTGTRLTIVEAGFDALPAGRRDEAFRMNTRGWEAQLRNVGTHVGG